MSFLSLLAQAEEVQFDQEDFNQLISELESSSEVSTEATGIMVLFGGVYLFFWLVVMVIMVVSLWKIFTKAGQPGWASLIPIYNIYILLQIVDRPTWWILLFLIPFVSIVVSLILALDLAKAFGKSEAFGVFGLWLFSIVGYPMLAFGDATYKGEKPAVAPKADEAAA